MKTWTEVEEMFLTNQPKTYAGRGRSKRCIPDPAKPPTEAYLFCWKCERTKRGIRRKRHMETLRGDKDSLDQQLAEMMDKPDVILIASQQPTYASYRGEPERLADQSTGDT